MPETCAHSFLQINPEVAEGILSVQSLYMELI